MIMWARGQLELLAVFSILPLPLARPIAMEARDARPPRFSGEYMCFTLTEKKRKMLMDDGIAMNTMGEA